MQNMRPHLQTAGLTAILIAIVLFAVGLRPACAADSSTVPGGPNVAGYLPAAVPAVSGSTVYHLSFAIKVTKQAELDQFIDDLNDPTSPNFRQYLTPTQFGARFGASDADVGAILDYIRAQGFANPVVWPNHLFVSADATAEQVTQAFGVTIGSYQRPASLAENGEPATFIAPTGPLSVPPSVASVLTGVFGLSDFAYAHSNAVRITAVPFVSPNIAASPLTGPPSNSGSWTPSQATANYNFTALHAAGLHGEGQTVGIYSPTTFNPADVDTFATYYGFKPGGVPTYTIVHTETDGGPGSDNTGEVEACLDQEIIIGQSPHCTIDMFEAPNLDAIDNYNAVISSNIKVLSDSWAYTETQLANYVSFRQALDVCMQILAADGQAHYNATGDQGSAIGSRLSRFES